MAVFDGVVKVAAEPEDIIAEWRWASFQLLTYVRESVDSEVVSAALTRALNRLPGVEAVHTGSQKGIH